MKRETKKQLFSIFVLLMFMGSSIAFAVSSALGRGQPAQEQSALISDKPFTDSEASRYLENNMVVVDFYYSQTPNGAADSAVTELAQELSGYIAVDKIDADKYRSLAAENDITEFPSFVLKGTTIDTVSGAVSKQELKERICRLYAQPIAACG